MSLPWLPEAPVVRSQKPQHLLRLGALILADGGDRRPAPDGAAYSFAVLGEDYTTGEAEPIERTLRTLLQDGAVTITDGLENRTAQFQVVITAPDSKALAEGEAALAAELGRANELSWTPPDGWGPTSVLEVFTSSMSHVADDLAEVLHLERTYQVRLVCHPTVRSVEEVTTAAVSMPTTGAELVTVTISDASTTAGWSTNPGAGTLSDIGDRLQVAGSRTPQVRYVAGPIDLNTTPYLSLVMYRVGPQVNPPAGMLPRQPRLYIDGVLAELVAEQRMTSSETRYFWRAAPGVTTANALEFRTEFPIYTTVGGITHDYYKDWTRLRFRSLQRTNRPPITGTARQKARTVEVAGAARTQGALLIEHATSPLGSVLAYTWPSTDSAYTPPLRSRRDGGALPVTDETLVSGAREVIAQVGWTVPVVDLVPGSHQLVARVSSNTVGTFNLAWAMQGLQSATLIGPALSGVTPVTFATANTWQIVVLTRQMLPTIDTPFGSTAGIKIVVDNTTSAVIELDEAWLFNTSIGHLTWVELGNTAPTPGGASNRLWISTPTTARPRPAIYRGNAADGSDAYSAGAAIRAFGRHQFLPGVMKVFTVTSGALDADVSLSHYPRWPSHAAI